MILLISVSLICIATLIAVLRAKRPLKHILAEAKYEMLYNIMGSKALLEDLFLKSDNNTELPSRSGQVVLITGGTRGIGVEVVKMLMQCDMHVIIGCRNVAMSERLIEIIRDDGIETGELKCFKLDVSSINSVKQFASTIVENYPKINILINNAGIMFGPYIETIDGYESQFATNYLGHYLLTHLLLPQIKEAGSKKSYSRIINVTSCAHYAGKIDFEDINNRSLYISAAAYAQSKLAQILFANYLDTKLKNEGAFVQVHSVHPGIVNTELFDGTPIKTIFPWLPSLVFKTPQQGAMPIVFASIAEKLEKKGGTYISNCKIAEVSPLANDTELQEKLFQFTNSLLNIDKFGVVESEN